MIDYRIVRAGPEDWKQIRSIRLRGLAESPAAFGSTLAAEQKLTDSDWRARTENPLTASFLARTENSIDLGIAVGAPYKGKDQTAGLFGMWVAPEARRHKIGAALVRAVVEWARSANYRRIVLDVGDSNHQAIRLYESCGFTPTGVTGFLPPPRQHIREHEMEILLDGP